jgi:hypothetical protein
VGVTVGWTVFRLLPHPTIDKLAPIKAAACSQVLLLI